MSSSFTQFNWSHRLRCELVQFQQLTFSSRVLSEIKKVPLFLSFEVFLSHSNGSIRSMWKLEEALISGVGFVCHFVLHAV